ncbi:type II secretion system F family protein [Humidisolicoccus flavus]|uniref:type II secretion system F family protein n=1 Tax=Humidisolicoccus flavus TaxID=3111414 RepID=UPI00324FE0C7
MTATASYGLTLGLVLGLGLVLLVSPRLWPRCAGTPRDSVLRPPSKIRDMLTAAGHPQMPTLVLPLIAVIAAVVCGGITLVVIPILPLALIAASAGAALPLVAVQWQAKKKRLLLDRVWPDVVDHLLAAIRGGMSLPDAMTALQTIGPEETKPYFREFAIEYRSSGSFDYCIDQAKMRFANGTADRLLETMRMAKEVGGNELGRVLSDLAAYLREESATRGELLARQSWIVNAARLGVAAPWIVLLLLATRPEGAAAYNSSGGLMMILGGVIVTVIAYRTMIRLGRLPEDARWFA